MLAILLFMYIFLRNFKIMTYKLIKDSMLGVINQVRFTDPDGHVKLIPFMEDNLKKFVTSS